ncbi:hypothetical protein [Methanobrevibacter sp.]|uniref:hypothetical protein n=1 Tax=Methanobrevibacter sp. TaxID=66852 RepID=UPI00386EE254
MIGRDVKNIHKSPKGRFEVVYLKPLNEYRIWDCGKKKDIGSIIKSKEEAIDICDKLELFGEIIRG